MATPEQETAQESQELGAHNVQVKTVLETVFPGQFRWSLLSAALTAHTSWSVAGMLGNLVDGVDFRDFLSLRGFPASQKASPVS